MFRYEILSKCWRSDFDCVRFGPGVTGCIGLAYWNAQMYSSVEARRQIVLHVTLGCLAHGDSSGSVAFLKDARLERSLECRRREEKNGLLFQAYAYLGPRADGLARRHHRQSANRISTMSSTAITPQGTTATTVAWASHSLQCRLGSFSLEPLNAGAPRARCDRPNLNEATTRFYPWFGPVVR